MLKKSLLLTLAAAAFTLLVAANVPNPTLNNLQEAFNGESNAHARYLAFAAKADADGYADVAALFRAAARAEEIHAGNHAKVIRALGGDPAAKIDTAAPKGTAENLKAAIAGESYERDTMYPEFLGVARQAGLADAVRSFNFAKEAEAGHAALYAKALETLQKRAGVTYYVCPVCGRTESVRPGGKCPVCFTEGTRFEPVK